MCLVASNYKAKVIEIFRRVRKLQTATITFIVSVRPPVCSSVRPSVCMEQLGFHWTDFHEIWYLRIFRKSVEKILVSLKSDKNKGYFTWRPIGIFIIFRSFLPRIRNISDKLCTESHNIHFVFSNFFFLKLCRLWDNVEKYCRTG